MSANELFWLWIVGSIAGGIGLGVAGLFVRPLRYVLAGLAPVMAAGLFIYSSFRGGPNDCVMSHSPPGYSCQPTSYLSDIGWYGVAVVILVTLVSMTPLVAAVRHSRAATVLGAFVLTVVITLYILGLLTWVPVAGAVLAAAIAGPPGRARQPVQQAT